MLLTLLNSFWAGLAFGIIAGLGIAAVVIIRYASKTYSEIDAKEDEHSYLEWGNTFS